MRTAGILLVVLGVSSFLFPLIGRRSMILGLFGPYEKAAAISAIVLGAIALAVDLRNKRARRTPAGP